MIIVSLAFWAFLLLGCVAISWRLARWSTKRVHPLFFWYLFAATLAGVAFASVPALVAMQGFDWWSDYCQKTVFFALIIWVVVSIFAMYYAPKRYLLTPLFGVIASFVCMVLFFLQAEAGDLPTLAPQFWMMKCVGSIDTLLSVCTILIALRQQSAE